MEGTLKMVQPSTIGLTAEPRDLPAGSTSRNPSNAEAGPAGGDVTIDMRVAQLLCSRLCHDLVGSSGAIHNGIELMSEDGGTDPAALSLIAASATHLNNRLAFYRVAFGLGGGGPTMTLDAAKALVLGVIASHRVEVDWRIEPRKRDGRNQSLLADEIRLVLGLVLIGADALPRGGTLRVRCVRTAAGTEANVAARGARAGLPENLLAAMNPDVPSDSLTPRTVHGYFTASLARRLGAAVAMETANADEVALAVSLPRPRQTEPIPFPAPASPV